MMPVDTRCRPRHGRVEAAFDETRHNRPGGGVVPFVALPATLVDFAGLKVMSGFEAPLSSSLACFSDSRGT